MPIVEVNGQEIEFPDTMSGDEIKSVLRTKFPPQATQAPIEEPQGGLWDELLGRGGEVQNLADMRRAGEITRPEELIRATGQGAAMVGDVVGAGIGETVSGINKLTGGRLGEYAGNIASSIGSLPSMGGGTIGEALPQEMQQIGKAYGDVKEQYPRTVGLAEGLGNISTMIPGVKQGEKIISGTAKAVKEFKPVELPGRQQIKERASQLYKEATQKGASFKDETIVKLQEIVEGQRISDPLAKATLGEDAIDDLASRLGGAGGEKMTLESFEQLDKRLGALGQKAFTSGDSDLARRYDNIQGELRNIVEKDDFIEGTREGIDSYRQATKLWAEQSKLRDIDDIIENAQYYVGGEGAGLKAGFSRLAKSKKMTRYSPKVAKAIQKAAKSGQLEGLLRTLGSRLMVIGGAVSGGGAGALAGYAASQAARGGAAALKGAEASKAGRLISKKAMQIDPTLGKKSSLGNGAMDALKVLDTAQRATLPAGFADLTKEQLNYIMQLPPEEAKELLRRK